MDSQTPDFSARDEKNKYLAIFHKPLFLHHYLTLGLGFAIVSPPDRLWRTPMSDRARRDEVLRPEIRRVFEENWRIYGARKIWQQLRREGFDVARCTVARLMRVMGIQGVIRGKPHRTTIPDKKLPCPLDRVNRQFGVPAPNMLWVSDFSRTGCGR